jgi:hypothetical protein
MTARMLSASNLIARPHLIESSGGLCVMFDNGAFLAFDDADSARELAAVITEAADLLDAQKAQRAAAGLVASGVSAR